MSEPKSAPERGAEVELMVVTITLDASDIGSLLAVLSKYVVLARMEAGCRNIDMVVSETHHGRILLVEKWESPAAQIAHFDGKNMVEMAKSCTGLLSVAPVIDLWSSISAHDLS